VNAFAKSQYLQPNTNGCFPRFKNGGDQFRSAAKLLSKDEARRIAANIAKLPEHLRQPIARPFDTPAQLSSYRREGRF
jgi:hypothetical protein